MGVQIQGVTATGAIIAEVDPSGRAIRASRRPLEALGIYRKSASAGPMAAGLVGGSDVYQFRWGEPIKLALVHRIILEGLGGTPTAFKAGTGEILLSLVRAWTVAGSGGNALDNTGNNGKLRTSMPTSLMASTGDMRIAGTAALTTGTRATDAAPLTRYTFSVGTIVSVQYVNQVFLYDSSATDMPLVFAYQEGFAVRAVVPATGTWQFGLTVEWSEVAAY